MKTYDSNICSGSLLINESRIIAGILLSEPSENVWREKIFLDNVLQKKSPVTVRKQSTLIRDRLQLVKPELWQIIANRDSQSSTQGTLVSAVKESRILGDFIRNVVRRRWETHIKELNKRDWDDFLETGEQVSPNVAEWGEATRTKVAQVIFRILAEARMIESTRKKNIQTIRLMPDVKDYLVENKEEYVLECLDWFK